jgi:membrane-bound serine protease (ClpP class)
VPDPPSPPTAGEHGHGSDSQKMPSPSGSSTADVTVVHLIELALVLTLLGWSVPRAALAAVVAAALLASPVGAQQNGAVPSIELSGTIDPATASWMSSALEDAQDAPLAIVRLDTPGGLDTSMRAIVRDIIAAPMPVVVYVSPDGARAASAGMFITEAGDVAAMAPQTNIGSATPITLGGGRTDEVLGRKVRNDAAAYARALAEGHGRNGDLAERMVRDAVNVTAERAEDEQLIDLVAPEQTALLRALDGFEVKGPKAGVLDTDGLHAERRDMPLQYEIQQLLVNPNVAFLLLLGGLLGIVFEVTAPGLVGPGLFGAVALVLGLYGTAQLPVTAAGAALLLLAAGLLAAELFVGSHGVLAAAGVTALVAGGLLLFDTGSDALRVSVPIAVAAGAGIGVFTLFAVGKALRLRQRPARGGSHDLVGHTGTVRVTLDPLGQVMVAGELWRGRAGGDAALPAGARVRVLRVDGLTLTVEPDEKEPT